ncbi:Hsp20 family protein [Buchnera aphidicola]|uniref:HSP20-like chaperone n=2 Tax=cellular organisms TaxID=131567 RepID=A0A8T1XLB4_ARASU|nr:Hsp20 family protein [Buchnera aphidicola]KAG7531913.1 HSP20-like chaperone [Arabidopsis suecica]AHG59827.1 Ibpa [Buchnera aphidicola str. USDA (Myzus persicae)]AHG60407.1 Ibpa [Buchnera aphidicola str. W106 (Myzus persicae)]AHG60980.1 Ibpa [Buchnera aphidicola str. G002 (Myzus persicae)]AHG61552.1 Ibpa [Buchnera aphidicola str. F009 (Myzus persicae)]
MSYRSLSFVPSFNDHDIFSNRFNQIDKMFSTLTGEKPISDTPVYNLCQTNETEYELTLSIPGYEEKELDISVHNSQLSIKGRKEKQKEQNNNNKETIKYLHKGIIFNNFSLSFNLDHKVKVKKAELSLGLLKLYFECSIPEEEKPKKISINTPNDIKNIDKK